MKATGLKSLRGSNSKTRAINTTLKMKRPLYRALVILSIIEVEGRYWATQIFSTHQTSRLTTQQISIGI
jgi:hypothetical protein